MSKYSIKRGERLQKISKCQTQGYTGLFYILWSNMLMLTPLTLFSLVKIYQTVSKSCWLPSAMEVRLTSLASHTEHSFKPVIKKQSAAVQCMLSKLWSLQPHLFALQTPSPDCVWSNHRFSLLWSKQVRCWVVENGPNWWELVHFWRNCPVLPGTWFHWPLCLIGNFLTVSFEYTDVA